MIRQANEQSYAVIVNSVFLQRKTMLQTTVFRVNFLVFEEYLEDMSGPIVF